MGSKRGSATLAVVLATALALLAMGGCTTPAGTGGPKAEAKAPYKLGVVVSLTGTYAGLGTPEKAAIQLEMKRVNDAGGVNGHPIEVVFEDDATGTITLYFNSNRPGGLGDRSGAQDWLERLALGAQARERPGNEPALVARRGDLAVPLQAP